MTVTVMTVVVVSIVLLNRVSLCHSRCRLDRHRVVISVVESPNWVVVVVVVVGRVV